LIQPTVRQYFHKGLLWRASETTEVASFELFVDLLYVGILAINGVHAAEDATGEELLRFSVTFIMSWKIWGDLTLIISWFETDDIAQVSEPMTHSAHIKLTNHAEALCFVHHGMPFRVRNLYYYI
jgi:hypothetical protein